MPDALERIGVHLPSLAAYLVNFLVLLGVLYLIAYRPFQRMMRERTERVQRGIAHVEAAERMLAEAEVQRERLLHDARQAARAAVESAQRQAEVELAQARRRAQEDAEALGERARGHVKADAEAAREELRAEIGGLTVLAAERVLGRTLDRQMHVELIAEAVREVLALAPDERTRGSALYARVTSAVAPTPDEDALVAEAAARLAGRELPLVRRVDPHLLGGLTIVVGDTVVDASIQRRLRLPKAIKIGGRLAYHARRLVFQFAEMIMTRDVFSGLLERISKLCPRPG